MQSPPMAVSQHPVARNCGGLIPWQQSIQIRGLSPLSRVSVPTSRKFSGSILCGEFSGATSMRKCKASSMSLRSRAFLQGEGLNRLRSGIPPCLPCCESRRKAVVTCQVAGAAVPGDATNGTDDYIPNFTGGFALQFATFTACQLLNSLGFVENSCKASFCFSLTENLVVIGR
jgi:hypothetical protein